MQLSPFSLSIHPFLVVGSPMGAAWCLSPRRFTHRSYTPRTVQDWIHTHPDIVLTNKPDSRTTFMSQTPMKFSSTIHSRDGQRIQGWTLGMSLDPHPHLLDIHGVWPDRSGNHGYLVSTRLDMDLTQCVPNASELTTTMRGVLDALTYLHKHSIVHGDVKAGNIFLSFAPQP